MPETRGLCLSEEQTISTVRICSKTSSILYTGIYGTLSDHVFMVSNLSYFDLNILDFKAAKDWGRKASHEDDNRTLQTNASL